MSLSIECFLPQPLVLAEKCFDILNLLSAKPSIHKFLLKQYLESTVSLVNLQL